MMEVTMEPPPQGSPRSQAQQGTKRKRAANEAMTVTDGVRQQIADAMLLLEYAIGAGFKTADRRTLPASVITAIKALAAAVRYYDLRTAAAVHGTLGIMLLSIFFPSVRKKFEAQQSATATTETQEILVSQWVEFEIAYYELTQLMSPISAETLRNTQEERRFWFFDTSPALTFTKLLWVITIAFAAVVTFNEWWALRYGVPIEGEVDWQNDVLQALQILAPPAYGGLGACVYLLRSAHRFIHERSFDLHRRPEYLNRILLGAIAGGAIILFINEDVMTDDGAAIRLSGAALGFLAGYSTDLLFNAIERVSSALLPKVGLETVRRAPTPAPSPPVLDMSLADLIEHYEAAQDADTKTLIKALIKQFYKVDVE